MPVNPLNPLKSRLKSSTDNRSTGKVLKEVNNPMIVLKKKTYKNSTYVCVRLYALFYTLNPFIIKASVKVLQANLVYCHCRIDCVFFKLLGLAKKTFVSQLGREPLYIYLRSKSATGFLTHHNIF